MRFGLIIAMCGGLSCWAMNMFLPMSATDPDKHFDLILSSHIESKSLLKLYRKLAADPKQLEQMISDPNFEHRRIMAKMAVISANTNVFLHVLEYFEPSVKDWISAAEFAVNQLSLDQFTRNRWKAMLRILLECGPAQVLIDFEDKMVQRMSHSNYAFQVILDMMLDDERFPLCRKQGEISAQWHGLLSSLIIDKNYPAIRQIIADWPRFKQRVNLSLHRAHCRPLLSDALHYGGSDIFYLVCCRYYTFMGLKDLGPREKVLELLPFLRNFSWRLTPDETKADVHERFLTAMHKSLSKDVGAQAALMTSSSFAEEREIMIARGILRGRSTPILAAIKAGAITYHHLNTIHQAGTLAKYYQRFDQSLGNVDLSSLEYRSEGRALVWIILRRSTYTMRAKALLNELLTVISKLGPLEALSRLDEAHKMFVLETEIRRALPRNLKEIFQTPSKLIYEGDLVYELMLALEEMGQLDLLDLRYLPPKAMFDALACASAQENYRFMHRLATTIALRFPQADLTAFGTDH